MKSPLPTHVDHCELCGERLHGDRWYVYAPFAVACKQCRGLGLVPVCDRLLDRGIRPQDRMPYFPEEE